MNPELTMLSKFVAKKVEDNNLITDNIPHAVAGGIVYFICHNCQMNVTKTDIKNICGVSEVTINKCFMKMQENIDQLLPRMIRMKYSVVVSAKNES
jgi:transcription initiation factor TFIIIB Brf1 subunit/transcription initiation factor TFIIB